jgi:hypothetical protein
MATDEAEVAVPVIRVTEGTAPEPEAAVAPEVVVGAHAEVLPRASTEVVVREPEILPPPLEHGAPPGTRVA